MLLAAAPTLSPEREKLESGALFFQPTGLTF
jgi:hypothetical protein